MKAYLHFAFVLLSVALTALGPTTLFACVDCGGKGKDDWAAREREPKASQLFPDAPVVAYELSIQEERVDKGQGAVRALTVNGGIPGPTLRFRVGDVARITVNNRLPQGETSVHWHGLLLPNLEDGVPHLTTPPLSSGKSRTFEFLLTHSGTYWYHSHTGLQEQRGVYGSIVVEPKPGTPARTDLPPIDREEVLVLSDWTRESPEEVLRTLYRGSDWYALRKGTTQSLLGAYRTGHLSDFIARERSRLPPMDVSDVAYDAFLVNGQTQLRLPGRPGETVRLRVINAAASTYFYAHSATGPLTVIAADGPDVVPIQQNRLLIGMAETYDLLITLPTQPGTWEWRATAQDGSGYASVLFGDGEVHNAAPLASLDPYSMDDLLTEILDESDAPLPRDDEEALSLESARPLPPYRRLQSPTATALPADAPRRDVTLRLTGDMARYLWSIDGKTIDEKSTLAVRKGEVLRLTLVNDTMMHHPLHLHGHFFRLLMPEGPPDSHAPLKHTVDVPPMTKRTIEFLADQDRDWLFHCHLLYHMKAGMARVVSYPAAETQEGPYRPKLGDHAMPHVYAWAEASLLSQQSRGAGTVQRGRDRLEIGWDVGWERVSAPETEIDVRLSRYYSPRWSSLLGYRYNHRTHNTSSGIVGVRHLLPYLIEATATVATEGTGRLGLTKETPLTARLRLYLEIEYDSRSAWSGAAHLAWRATKQISVAVRADSEYGPGAGFDFEF